jgi:hypothetical protein
MASISTWYTVPNPDQRGGSLQTGESVLGVAVKMTNPRINYFLTLGKPFHRKRLDEIAKWVFERATAFSLDGTPEEAEVCYSLSDAADEPYFYEQYLQLVNTLTHMKTDAESRPRSRRVGYRQSLLLPRQQNSARKCPSELLVHKVTCDILSHSICGGPLKTEKCAKNRL